MSSQSVAEAASQWSSYTDASAGIALEHPVQWKAVPGMTGLLVAVVGPQGAGGFAPNLNVVRRVNDVQLSLDDLALNAFREVKRVLTDAVIIDLDHAVVSREPARRFLFAYRQGIYGLTGEQWVWLTRQHIWTVTAGAATEDYDSVADELTRVVRSLRVDEH